MTSEKTLRLIVVAPHAEMITPKYFPNWADGGVRLTEECGRASHKSEHRIAEGSAEPFIKRVAIDWRHESILEHLSFTACFTGSRAMSHQLVRHRLCAFTQESQRYCDYADDNKHEGLRVIVPPSIAEVPDGAVVTFQPREDDYYYSFMTIPNAATLPDGTVPITRFGAKFVLWVQAVARSYGRYISLRDEGVPAEDARYLLPNAAKTDIYITANVREWRHVFAMRLDKHAAWEIKTCVRQVYNYFRETAPLFVAGLRTHSGEEMP